MPYFKHLRRLIPYYHPYLKEVLWGLVLVVLSSAVWSVIPWLLRQALDSMGAREGALIAWRYGAAIALVSIVGGALRYGMRELLNGASRRIEFDLRNDLFARLTQLDTAYFAGMRTGDIMARLTNDLSAVRMAAGPAVMYLTNTVFGGIFAIAFMLRINPVLTALALLPMILLPVIGIRMGKALHDRFESVQEHFSTLTTRAQENLAGARIVRAYRQESAEIERFARLNEEYLARNMSLVRLWGILHPVFGLLAGIATAIVLGVGGLLAMRGVFSVGSFVAFSLYLAMLMWPLIALGWVINLFQRGEASMTRLHEILDARSALITHRARALSPARAGRRIVFRNVGFHYPVADGADPRWVLRDVSFVCEPGQTVGIAGATGSGKSALMDLLPRLHDPQEGEILLDGIPLTELELVELRAAIGYVTQESLLFSDTIASNLAYGARAERDWMEAAATAQLSETVSDFPARYQTMLGERGINLSGGQKQRVALARALARRPSVLLLDDALSAVDTRTEADILGALRSVREARTSLIASHRVSALRDADHIVVLDGGRAVEHGRHSELLARGGRYWSLLRRQQLVEAIEDGGDEHLAALAASPTIG
ncbi:MAG TPA: ABC transporter ATP-binding protein [Gemmatimonadaceae bacterium]|nr:ABC transporter ATP-binding protein [Gemmatimonadaceae bacterium]